MLHIKITMTCSRSDVYPDGPLAGCPQRVTGSAGWKDSLEPGYGYGYVYGSFSEI